MTDLECDVAIIGAGTAGLAAERSARRAGARTLLIDDAFPGTTCASVGCMPSKLLIAAAEAAHAVRASSVFGVHAHEPKIDGAAVMRRVQHERDEFVAGSKESLEKLPEGIMVRARARFVDAHTLSLADGRTVKAKSVVLATGSRPHVSKEFEALGHAVLTNETVFELATLPKSMAVIGAGPLGLELAQAFSRLGVDTEVFDQGTRVAGVRDEDVAAVVKEVLGNALPLHPGVELKVAAHADGARLEWSGESSGSRVFERVLVATGRPPQLDELQLDKTGIALDEHGVPQFDRATLQCGTSSIFIAGDADADVPVLHEASAEGAIAGNNAANFPDVKPGHRTTRLAIMFTDPPLAVIGEPPKDDAVIGCASYKDQGRAKVEARNTGLVKLYATRPTGAIVAATLFGPGMDHMAHLVAWAVERGETADTILGLPFYHPTLEEGLRPALRQICDELHVTLGPDVDEGSSPGI